MNDDQCGNEICLPKICRIDTDCGPGNKCNSQHCIIRCQYTGQCPDGKNCVDDYCSIPPGDLLLNLVYRRCTIITRGSYTFYPLFEVHLCTVTFGLVYGYHSRAVSNQERVIVAPVQWFNINIQILLRTVTNRYA